MGKRISAFFQNNNKAVLVIVDAVLFIALIGMVYWSGVRDRTLAAELQAGVEAEMAEAEEAMRIEQEKQAQAEATAQLHADVVAAVEGFLPGIVCWGDSLTVGAGGDGTSFPSVIEGLINENICNRYNNAAAENIAAAGGSPISIPVVNMGVGGESSLTIAGRNGAIPFAVAKQMTIPPGTDPVPITMASINGGVVAPLRQGNAGMDKVTIDGIEGVIEVLQDAPDSSKYSYTFKRAAAGEGKEIAAGTQIITAGAQNYKNYIPVIFMGQNGGWDSIPQLIEQQRAMVAAQTQNNDRYIILGLTTGNEAARAALEAAMEAEHGGRYINLRAYLSGQGIYDAGIEPTAADTAAMSKGAVPPSLLSEGVLFNSAGYKLIGDYVYARMEQLGYLNEVTQSIDAGLGQ